MKNLFKRLTFIAVSACIVLTGVFAAACKNDNSNDPTVVGYSVTVLYPDGSPVKATDSNNARALVAVTLQDNDGKDVTSYESGVLDEYGTANTDYKVPGEYKIAVYNVPEGYAYDPVITTTADVAKYTVTLVNNNLAYEIEAQLPDGSPYANKSVKLMKNNSEIASLTTDAQGKATTPVIAADNYDVVVELSKDYGYKPVQTSKSVAKTTVKLFDVHKIEFKDSEIADSDTVAVWEAARNSTTLNHYTVDSSVNNYIYTADVRDGGEYFFRIYAPWTGRYSIHCMYEFKKYDNGDFVLDEFGGKIKEANYQMLFYKDNFGTPIDQWTLNGDVNGGNNSQFLDLNEGDEYIISVKSKNGLPYTMQFLMAFNVQPQVLETAEAGTYTLSFKDINYAQVKFKPSESGIYTVSSLNGEYTPELVALSSATMRPLDGDYHSDYYGTNVLGACNNADGSNFTFTETVQQSFTGNTYIYRIALTGDHPNPAELQIKIERTGDAPPEIVYETVKVTPQASLEQQTAPAGTWTWLNVNGDEPVEKDGAWYVTVDGVEKQVFVAITKKLTGSNPNIAYSFATIEYMGEGSGNPDSDDDDDKPQNTPQNNYLTVTVSADLKKYNYTDFIKTYSGYCTSDGCYALNGELKTFLERYMANHWSDLVLDPANNRPAKPWLIGCGYYK